MRLCVYVSVNVRMCLCFVCLHQLWGLLTCVFVCVCVCECAYKCLCVFVFCLYLPTPGTFNVCVCVCVSADVFVSDCVLFVFTNSRDFQCLRLCVCECAYICFVCLQQLCELLMCLCVYVFV